MWNDSKSLMLSKVCVIAFMAILLICMSIAPLLVARLTAISISAGSAGRWLFLVTVYTGSIPAAALLICLFMLLVRIGKGSVFVRENTASLRYISWCCFAGSVICLASALYYTPWLAIGISAAFVGIVMRVVKNVFAKAVSLQDDASLVI